MASSWRLHCSGPYGTPTSRLCGCSSSMAPIPRSRTFKGSTRCTSPCSLVPTQVGIICRSSCMTLPIVNGRSSPTCSPLTVSWCTWYPTIQLTRVRGMKTCPHTESPAACAAYILVTSGIDSDVTDDEGRTWTFLRLYVFFYSVLPSMVVQYNCESLSDLSKYHN